MNPIEVPPEILSMPVDDRLLLVGKIWDSISKDGLPPISAATKRLIDERIDAANSAPEAMIPARVVFEELGRKE
jgi:putative addiction module component (TIGR02574 family)